LLPRFFSVFPPFSAGDSEESTAFERSLPSSSVSPTFSPLLPCSSPVLSSAGPVHADFACFFRETCARFFHLPKSVASPSLLFFLVFQRADRGSPSGGALHLLTTPQMGPVPTPDLSLPQPLILFFRFFSPPFTKRGPHFLTMKGTSNNMDRRGGIL